MSDFTSGRPAASRALALAAQGGLLLLAQAGCVAKTDSAAQAKQDAGSVADGATCAPDGGVVTSAKVVSDMTLAKFTTECDGRGGSVEIHPHCGGANTCAGMSYDEGNHMLTEHTCRGVNTCAGYSCVIPC